MNLYRLVVVAEAAEVAAAVGKLILSTDNRTGIKSYTIP